MNVLLCLFRFITIIVLFILSVAAGHQNRCFGSLSIDNAW